MLWMLAMSLADLWGIADLHFRKDESTKWLKQKLRHVSLNKPMADLCFLFLCGLRGGRLEFVTQAFRGSPKFFGSGLAISMTNYIVQNY